MATPPVPARPAPAVRFGPAGWSYADWAGVVYPSPCPPGFHPLDLLPGLFPTIEVNATFYRDLPPRQIEAWCRRTEHDPAFRWCFKLHRRLSHVGVLPTPAELLAAARGFSPARERGCLGALLLQFPWSLRRDDDTATRLAGLAAAARAAGWPLAIEVRHAAWREASGFAPVACDQPALRDNLLPDEALAAALAAPDADSAPLYVRLHGRNAAAWFAPAAGRDQRYDYLYDATELAQWTQRLRAMVAHRPAGAPVYVIANNHFRGQAVVNALQLQRLWSGLAPAVPDQLRHAYPRELAAFPAAAPVAPLRRTPRRPRREPGPDEPALF